MAQETTKSRLLHSVLGYIENKQYQNLHCNILYKDTKVADLAGPFRHFVVFWDTNNPLGANPKCKYVEKLSGSEPCFKYKDFGT